MAQKCEKEYLDEIDEEAYKGYFEDREEPPVKYADEWKKPAGQHYQRKKIKTFLSFLPKNASIPREETSILDVGCADGVITMQLAEMGYNMIGLDRSPYFLKDGKMKVQEKKLNIEFIRGDAANLPFKENSFDHVFSMAVFQYLPCPLTALREYVRVAKLGGVVIVDISNRYCLYYFGLNRIVHFLMPRLPTFSRKRKGAGRKASRFEMKTLFNDAGLTEIEIKPILFVWWYLPDWLLNIGKRIEFFLDKLPFFRQFLGVIVCKRVVTKNT